MAPNTFAAHGSPLDDDYGLSAVAQHNAATSNGHYSPYHEDSRGLGIFVSIPTLRCVRTGLTSVQHDGYPQEYHGHTGRQHTATPRSIAGSDGVRTRSSRPVKRTDSPFDDSTVRDSQSPATRPKRAKKTKPTASKMPKLDAPLSVLTRDMQRPMKDMDAWVNRSAEVRREEAEKRNGYITRPMNSFMLYRSAYADRTKEWCKQNNHQVVSSVSGESWPMEPEAVRNQFNEWAKIERANHAAAHPEYKFSPSKSTKKRKGEFSEDEAELSDLDRDPDGEYRAGGRRVRQKVQQNQMGPMHIAGPVGFDSHPYYGQQTNGYDALQYGLTSPSRPLPSNVAYDLNGNAYDPQTNTYLQDPAQQQHPVHQQPQYQYDVRDMRAPTPASMNGAPTLGGYGLPGGPAPVDEMFGPSRSATPMEPQQHYSQYGQPLYQHFHQPQQTSIPQRDGQSASQQQQMLEHRQYLQAASQPQMAIDPALGGDFMMYGHHESHFHDALGESNGSGLAGLPEYFEENTNPDQTLAPSWEPGSELED